MGLLKSLETNRQVAALKSEDPQVRQKAARRLGDLKDTRAVQPLAGALEDRDSGVRRTAAEALGRIGDARSTAALMTRLTDSSAAVREAAVKALNTVDANWPKSASAQKAVHSLVAALEHQDRDVQRLAALVLGKIGDPGSISPLVSRLTDGSTGVREAVASALNEIDPNWQNREYGQEAVRGLIASISHSDHPSREAAVRTLDGIAPDWQKTASAQKAIDASLHMLTGREASGRAQAAAGLDRLGWSPKNTSEMTAYYFATGSWDELLQVGESAIEYVVELMRRGDSETQRMAVEALSKIGGSKAIDALFLCLNESDRYSLRKTAGEALDSVDANWRRSAAVQAAIPGLVSSLKSRGPEAREKAAFVLGTIGDRSIVPSLIQGLDDNDADYAQGCAQALGQLGDERALTPLISKLRDGRGPRGLISSILTALGNMSAPPAQDELLRIVRSRGELCKDARDTLNRGRTHQDEHVLCPACRTYLGIRKELSPQGSAMAGGAQGLDRPGIVGNVMHRCPGCGDQVAVS
jgi:HEAT repeat protein